MLLQMDFIIFNDWVILVCVCVCVCVCVYYIHMYYIFFIQLSVDILDAPMTWLL